MTLLDRRLIRRYIGANFDHTPVPPIVIIPNPPVLRGNVGQQVSAIAKAHNASGQELAGLVHSIVSADPTKVRIDSAAFGVITATILDDTVITNITGTIGGVAIPTIQATGKSVESGFYTDFIIDHTKCGASDSSNFPVLIKGTYSFLKDVAHGGHVLDSAGKDILPFLDTGLTILAAFELEKYIPSTGEIIAHIKLPTLTHSANPFIRLKYGNISDTTDRSNKNAVWNDSYTRVYHMGDGSTLSGVDSATESNFTQVAPVSASAGQIYGAATISSSGYLTNAGAAVSSVPITFSAWVKLGALPTAGGDAIIAAIVKTSGTTEIWFSFYDTNHLRILEQLTGVHFETTAVASLDTTTWHLYHGVLTSDTAHIIYQDGVALSGVTTGTPVTPTGLTDTDIGALLFNTSSVLGTITGFVDEVRISNVARSADWITAEWNNQHDPASFYSVNAEVSL